MSLLPTLTCPRCGADLRVRVTTTYSDPDGFDTGGTVESEEVAVYCSGPRAHPFGRGLYPSHEAFNRWVQRYCPEWRASWDRIRKKRAAEQGR